MGMFDYLRCEVPTPDAWQPHDGLFQTKDLECELGTARITSDGKLIRQRTKDVIEVPKAERTYPDAPEGSFRSFAGSLKWIWEDWQDDDFTGDILFYGSELVEDPEGRTIKAAIGTITNGDFDQSVDGKRYQYVFHEYRARFYEGQLKGIKLLRGE